MTHLRSPELLHRVSSRLLIVDVQERLVTALAEDVRSRLISGCRFLVDAARVLGIPVTATEQYPKGLGPTVSSLSELIYDRPSKTEFSAVPCLGWPMASSAADDRFQIVIAGMETHVCVQQTVFDLLACGYQVAVAADALAARGDFDHQTALQRMASGGAIITTAESILFEWCETASAPEFKQISALVKERTR